MSDGHHKWLGDDESPATRIITAAMKKQQRYDDYFIDLATRTARMSHCERLKVGAVAVRESRPILTGWNGTSPGEDNCCEETSQRWGDDGVSIIYDKTTKQSVNHAERNLIEFASRKGISLEGCTLYITHAPCIECAKSIRNSGFIELVYKDVYRCDAGLMHLKNMRVRQYNER